MSSEVMEAQSVSWTFVSPTSANAGGVEIPLGIHHAAKPSLYATDIPLSGLNQNISQPITLSPVSDARVFPRRIPGTDLPPILRPGQPADDLDGPDAAGEEEVLGIIAHHGRRILHDHF